MTAMTTVDWLDLIEESGVGKQNWTVQWAFQGSIARIRNEQGACPLCALANEAGIDTMPGSKPASEAYKWALVKAFGKEVVSFGAHDIADAADSPLNLLPQSLQFVRLALGQLLNIPKEKL